MLPLGGGLYQVLYKASTLAEDGVKEVQVEKFKMLQHTSVCSESTVNNRQPRLAESLFTPAIPATPIASSASLSIGSGSSS